jgi:hypothetical protein
MPSGASPSGASPWAVLAAIILFALGVAFVIFGSVFAGQGLAKGPDSGGVREAFIGIGAVALVIGIVHVRAAVLIWARRAAGRSLGLVIAGLGTLLGGIAFAVALRGALDPPPGSGTPDLIGLLIPLPHLAALIGLIAGRRHFGTWVHRSDG